MKGRFIKGVAPNPNGRPKGTFSLTDLVRKELQKCPEGEDKKTYADLVIKRIMSKAIKDGDTRMIERIWAYMDGLPKQNFGFDEEKPLKVEITGMKILKDNGDKIQDKNRQTDKGKRVLD